MRLAWVCWGVVLGSLISMAFSCPVPLRTFSRVSIAKTQMIHFAQATQAFEHAEGRLPRSLRELTIPSTRNHGACYMSGIPHDPWGRPYRFRAWPDFRVQISSEGEDGHPNTADDIRWTYDVSVRGLTRMRGRSRRLETTPHAR